MGTLAILNIDAYLQEAKGAWYDHDQVSPPLFSQSHALFKCQHYGHEQNLHWQASLLFM